MATPREFQSSQRFRDEEARTRGGRPIHDYRLTELFGDLTRETTLLIQQEVELVRAEMTQKIDKVERGITSLSVGAVFLHGGLLVLLASAVFGLALVPMPLWASALIVGLAAALIGGVLLAIGRRNVRLSHLTPERTVETMRGLPERVAPHHEPRDEALQEAHHEHEEVRA